tara:strand:+ start:2309 stop:2923 length:615 start_codon:yes stop_codon:yes gene_type:complete
MAIARTTELQAVNTMLSAVGEPPINNLEGQKNADAAIAKNILDEVSSEVQTHGWHFNTQLKVELSPNSSSEITLDDNVVRVDTAVTTNGLIDDRDIVQRGGKLFDRTNNTSTFTKSVKATVIYLLNWDDIPEPARRYITVRAARIFQDRMVGSQAHHSFSREDEVRARALLREFEMDTGDYSIFDNYDTFNIVARPLVNRSDII